MYVLCIKKIVSFVNKKIYNIKMLPKNMKRSILSLFVIHHNQPRYLYSLKVWLALSIQATLTKLD